MFIKKLLHESIFVAAFDGVVGQPVLRGLKSVSERHWQYRVCWSLWLRDWESGYPKKRKRRKKWIRYAGWICRWVFISSRPVGYGTNRTW